MTLFWFLFALGPAIFYSLSNLVDQYIMRRWARLSPVAFLVISSFASLPVLFLLGLYVIPQHNVFDLRALFVVVLIILFLVGMIPYLVALRGDDVRNATPLFQTIPFYLCILAWVILGEALTVLQMIGGAAVMGASIMSLVDPQTWRANWRTIGLISLSAFTFAVHDLILRMISPTTPWDLVLFWYIFWWSLMGPIIYVMHPATRMTVQRVVRQSRGKIMVWCGLQQVNDFIAILCLTAALSFPVPAAVTSLVYGLKPFVILAMSAIAVHYLPAYFEVSEPWRMILYKCFWFMVALGGLYLVLAV